MLPSSYDQDDMGGIALGVIFVAALSLLTPWGLAAAFGLSESFWVLVAWWTTLNLWIGVPLFVLYGIGGFLMLVCVAGALAVTGYQIFLRVRALTEWLVEKIERGIERSAANLDAAARWTFGIIAAWIGFGLAGLGGVIGTAFARLKAAIEEPIKLRRLYREEYTDMFDSFREFRAFWDAFQRGENPPEDEEPAQPQPERNPLSAAIALMGLKQGFTRADLEARFRKLIKGVHPDVAGPNELAAQLIAAFNLIKEKKGWA